MSTDLDLTFNSPNGFVTTGYNLSAPEESECSSIALQPDGKIVMAGRTIDSSIGGVIALARYDTNGVLDPLFGTGGKVTAPNTPLGTYDFRTQSVVLQPDGKIVVCGTVYTPFTEMFVARFTSNGILDTSNFNSPLGYIIIPPAIFNSTYPGLTFDQAEARSVQIDTILTPNKIVIGGHVRKISPGLTRDFFAVARLDLNGTLDTTFNSTGVVAHNFNPLQDGYCRSLEVTNIGDYILGGDQGSNFAIVKLNISGSPILSFGSSGIAVIPNFFVGSQGDIGESLKIQPGGKIVLGGSTIKPLTSESCFAIARVDINSGALDSSFGIGGQVVTDLSTSSITLVGNSLAIQSDGKIILAGFYEYIITSVNSFALARYNTNGSLDLTFGINGNGLILEDIVPGPFQTMKEIGQSVAIQPDGKILLGGSMGEYSDISDIKFFILARYFGFPPFPPPPIPIVPICFPAGTPVLTDQGNIDIEKIVPEIHTINNKKIIAITQSLMNDKNIISIEKHSLGLNIPNKKTYISNNHCIVYKNKLVPANYLVNRIAGVYFVKYNNEILYNVLMEKHYIMRVNNIRVETLNPKNIVAKLYTDEYSPQEKTRIILEINENINKRKIFGNSNNNITRRKLSLLRYSPLISRINFHTRKHFIRQSNPQAHTYKQNIHRNRNNNYKFTHSFRRRR